MTNTKDYKHVCAKAGTHQLLKIYAAENGLRSLDEAILKLFSEAKKDDA